MPAHAVQVKKLRLSKETLRRIVPARPFGPQAVGFTTLNPDTVPDTMANCPSGNECTL
jgi:hypothetical protein